jgi:hypothetical protein
MAGEESSTDIGSWPLDGLRIKDAAIRVGGSTLWGAFDTACRERQPFLPAQAAFLAPLLSAWDSGQLVAKGRREDPLAAPVEIPPPVTGWRFRIVDLDRSIISCQSARRYLREKIFDLRFWPKDPPPSPAAAQAELSDYRITGVTKITPQTIVGVIVDRVLYPEGLPPGIKPGTLRQQCDPHWEAACKANSVKFTLPDWSTFKAFIRRRQADSD